MIKDIIRTNKDVVNKSLKAFIDNPSLLMVGGVYLIVILIMSRLTPLFGFLGGLISVLVNSAIISNYMYLMHCILSYGKFDQDDFKAGFLAYFRTVWVVYLVIFTARYAINLLIMPIGAVLGGVTGYLMIGIWFIAFVVLNALPETLYQKNLMEWDSFIYSFEFIKENVFEWFVPNFILLSIFYGIYKILTIVIDKIISYIPVFSYTFELQVGIYGILMVIVLQFVIGFVMLYRGFLFKILSTTTRRKRYFMRNPNER